MVEREGISTNLGDDCIEHLIERHLDLSSFVHIFELADSFFCLHDSDHDDKSGTDSVCFFELYLDRWSPESEEGVESLFAGLDIEWESEFLCLVTELHDVEMYLVLVLQLYSSLDHRLDETLSSECESNRRHLRLVSDTLRETVVATSTTERILSPT